MEGMSMSGRIGNILPFMVIMCLRKGTYNWSHFTSSQGLNIIKKVFMCHVYQILSMAWEKEKERNRDMNIACLNVNYNHTTDLVFIPRDPFKSCINHLWGLQFWSAEMNPALYVPSWKLKTITINRNRKKRSHHNDKVPMASSQSLFTNMDAEEDFNWMASIELLPEDFPHMRTDSFTISKCPNVQRNFQMSKSSEKMTWRRSSSSSGTPWWGKICHYRLRLICPSSEW